MLNSTSAFMVALFVLAGFAVWLAFFATSKSTNSSRQYPTLAQALGLVFAAIALSTAIEWPIGVIPYFQAHPMERALIAKLVFYPAILLLAATKAKLNVGDMCLQSVISFRFHWLVFLIPAAIGCKLMIREFDYLITGIVVLPDIVSTEPSMGGFASLSSHVILPAVFEELLFRGVVLRGLVANCGRTRAILLSSLLFCVYHVNPARFVPTFLDGVFLGWVTLRLGSLIPAMCIHAVMNGLILLVTTSGTGAFGTLPEGSLFGQIPLWGSAVIFLSTVFSVLGISRFRPISARAHAHCETVK